MTYTTHLLDSLVDEYFPYVDDPDCLAADEPPVTQGASLASGDHTDDGRFRQAEEAPLEPDSFSAKDLPEVDDLRIAEQFVDAVRRATISDEPLDDDVKQRLLHPPECPLDITDPDLRLSIDLYLAVRNASESVYDAARESIMRRHPEDKILSYDLVKKKITELTGVTSVLEDMCIDSCVAFTGPFASLEVCPKCHKSRWDPIQLDRSSGRKKVPQRQFHTIPLGPQLQALARSPEGSKDLNYLNERLDEVMSELGEHGGKLDLFNDWLCGEAITDAVARGDIGRDDFVLMMSLDGAQLYRNKQSDCWVYIWVVMNHPPDVRYKRKHILIGAVIPGPNKPKNVDSYLLPGLRHISALQKQGFRVWNAHKNETVTSWPYVAFGTADTPGAVYLNGLAGHHAVFPCRLACHAQGRRKPEGKSYYPAHAKPRDSYDVEGCNHDDTSVRWFRPVSQDDFERLLDYVNDSPDQTTYEKRRKSTGISKSSIFRGLDPKHTLGIPACFPADLMHLASLNIPDILVDLWRGALRCDDTDNKGTWIWAVLVNDVWKLHGQHVAAATPYLPGSFDRPPRNPAEKISSGYKAWEYLTWIYGLAPALLKDILPHEYWVNFCKLVAAIRILHQRSISLAQLQHAHMLLVQFVEEYEKLYYQYRTDRLHFCRPSIHALPHLVPEAMRIGPGSYTTQWTLERVIGLLGAEIRQHSNPYANLSQRAVQWCQVNALKVMVPELDRDAQAQDFPKGSVDLGNDYVLLRARERNPHPATDAELVAINAYRALHPGLLCDDNELITEQQRSSRRTKRDGTWVRRWARLRLPNGQIARSSWNEKRKALQNVRMSRNVKVSFFCMYCIGRVIAEILCS